MLNTLIAALQERAARSPRCRRPRSSAAFKPEADEETSSAESFARDVRKELKRGAVDRQEAAKDLADKVDICMMCLTRWKLTELADAADSERDAPHHARGRVREGRISRTDGYILATTFVRWCTHTQNFGARKR